MLGRGAPGISHAALQLPRASAQCLGGFRGGCVRGLLALADCSTDRAIADALPRPSTHHTDIDNCYSPASTCTVPKLTKKKGPKASTGKVVGQNRKPGTVVPVGTVVKVTLGKG
jgi:hypothetical protein